MSKRTKAKEARKREEDARRLAHEVESWLNNEEDKEKKRRK